MNPVRTQVHFLKSHRAVLRAFRTGVSLHSHTELSREELSGLRRHLERMPVVSHFLQREVEAHQARNGRPWIFPWPTGAARWTRAPHTGWRPARSWNGSCAIRWKT